jgi:Polysaccharide lyase family 4, domain II
MRFLSAAAIAAASLALAGCPNPNNIGVQIYGSVVVTAVNADSGQPVAGADASAGSNFTCTTVANGMCTISQVPVGTWTINAFAPGLTGSVSGVKVAENQQTPVTIDMHP